MCEDSKSYKANSLLVSIVTFRSERVIASCLHSLQTAIGTLNGTEVHVVVVDNASQDGTVGTLKDLARSELGRQLEFELVVNSTNLGYGRAHNMAIERVDSDLVLVLNPDIALSASSVQDMLGELCDSPDLGAVGPCFKKDDICVPALCARNTILADVLKFWGGGFLLPSPRKLPLETLHHIDGHHWYLSGACLLVRRKALTSIGDGFDERYFMFMEDDDLCRSLVAAGWAIGICPEAIVTHVGGDSFLDDSGAGDCRALGWKWYVRILSGWYYHTKWSPRSMGTLALVVCIAALPVRAIASLLISLCSGVYERLAHPGDKRATGWLRQGLGLLRAIRYLFVHITQRRPAGFPCLEEG